MRYKTGYCFTAEDLYYSFDYKRLNIRKETVQKKYKVVNRQQLCGRILVYLFYLIILDIIKNNVTFA